ncbi:MAG: hypothetical protein HMLKMBBP_02510 [Planctomycetes bacterium]|nr:hypothetical protein [Planctomycetota bacterium]
MDWHGILETSFLVAFWAGLGFTILSTVLSGVFHHEFGSGSAFEGGDVTHLGGADIEHGDIPHSGDATVGWTDTQFPGASPLSPTVICSFVTTLGGVGYLALTKWTMGAGAAVVTGAVAALAIGAAVFFTLDWVLRKMQATSHVTANSLLGSKVRVQTSIEPPNAGSVLIESAAGRMTAPARGDDAAAIPSGAEAEIVRLDGGVYVVRETRESWMERSRRKPLETK